MTEIRENETVRVVDVPDCYLCGSQGDPLYRQLRDRLFAAPGTWDLLKCPMCGLIWLNPRPLAEEIAKLHAGYYTHSGSTGNDQVPGNLRGYVKNAILAESCSYASAERHLIERLVGKLLSAIGPAREAAKRSVMWLYRSQRGTLLDVGCGNGRFLADMRKLGWDVKGVEPDPLAVEIARQTLGLDVEPTTLEDAALPTGSFDAVTLNHVIEHVEDPILTLRECGRVLRERGRLVIVTPNVRSLASRWYGSSWYHLDPPRHMILFSPETLHASVERAGLRVLRLVTAARAAPSTWRGSQLIRRKRLSVGGQPVTLRVHDHFAAMVFWMVEHLLANYSPRGEEIVIVATKDER